MSSFNNHTGFTLLEVMAALAILSIGLLGIAGMQIFSLQTNHDAYLRTQATYLANSIVDKMRANPNVALNGGYNIALNDGPSGGSDCYSNSCSAISMAEFDLNTWKCALGKFQNDSICNSALNITPVLPNGDGRITRNGNQFTIRVEWQDSRNRVDGSTTAQFTEIVMSL